MTTNLNEQIKEEINRRMKLERKQLEEILQLNEEQVKEMSNLIADIDRGKYVFRKLKLKIKHKKAMYELKKKHKEELSKLNIEEKKVIRRIKADFIIQSKTSDYNNDKTREEIEMLDFKNQINKLITIETIKIIFLIIILIGSFLHINIIKFLFKNIINSLTITVEPSISFFEYLFRHLLIPIANGITIILLIIFSISVIKLTISKVIKIIHLFNLKEVKNPKIISIIKHNNFNILTERNVQIYIFKKAIKEYFIKTGNTTLTISRINIIGEDTFTFIREPKVPIGFVYNFFNPTEVFERYGSYLRVLVDEKGVTFGFEDIDMVLDRLIDYHIDFLINKLYERTDGYIDIKKEDLYFKI